MVFRFFIVMLFLSALAPLQVYAAEKLTYADDEEILDEAHVRGFIWGLPSSIIKEEEKSIFVEKDGDTLFYVDQIRGIRSSVNYEFDNDKLYRVRIFSEKKYTVPQNRFEDLVKIKRDLVKRFGEPLEENFEWKDEQSKKYPNEWGWAVYRGQLIVTIKWQDAETDVTLYLGAKKPANPVLFVTYEDSKAKKQKMQQRNDKALNVLR